MLWDHSQWIQHSSKLQNPVFTHIERTWPDRLWIISMSIHHMGEVPWIIELWMNHDLGPPSMDLTHSRTPESSVYPQRTHMPGPTLNNFNVYPLYGEGTMDQETMYESWVGTTLVEFSTLQNPRIQCLVPYNGHGWTDFEQFQCLSTIWTQGREVPWIMELWMNHDLGPPSMDSSHSKTPESSVHPHWTHMPGSTLNTFNVSPQYGEGTMVWIMNWDHFR